MVIGDGGIKANEIRRKSLYLVLTEVQQRSNKNGKDYMRTAMRINYDEKGQFAIKGGYSVKRPFLGILCQSKMVVTTPTLGEKHWSGGQGNYRQVN